MLLYRGVTTIEAREATASSLFGLDCILTSLLSLYPSRGINDDHFHISIPSHRARMAVLLGNMVSSGTAS